MIILFACCFAAHAYIFQHLTSGKFEFTHRTLVRIESGIAMHMHFAAIAMAQCIDQAQAVALPLYTDEWLPMYGCAYTAYT